jgi:hypothetical protein
MYVCPVPDSMYVFVRMHVCMCVCPKRPYVKCTYLIALDYMHVYIYTHICICVCNIYKHLYISNSAGMICILRVHNDEKKYKHMYAYVCVIYTSTCIYPTPLA